MRVLALAGYDSFLNTVRLIAPHFEKQGASVDFALISARKRKQISAEQIAEMGFSKPIPAVKIKDLCQSGDIQSYDIVLSCLEGMSTRHLFHYLEELGDARPLVICVYPGLVLRYAYDGFSMRAPADLLWLNCLRDLEAYREMATSFGIDPSNGRLFGSGSLLERIARQPAAEQSGPVVFFEQAVIPRYFDERYYLVKRFCDLARRFPERSFLLKARAPGKKATLHRTWYPIENIFDEIRASAEGVPDNVSLTDEKTGSLIARASHCLTVSSTVAVECLQAGVPLTIVSDFGAHDDYGLQYFYGSGLLRTFDDFSLEGARPNSDWLKRYTADPYDNIEQLVSEAMQMDRRRNLRDGAVSQASRSFAIELVENLGVSKYLRRSFEYKSVSDRIALYKRRLFNGRLR